MTLGFSTQINGKPNYFIEKIWSGLLELDYELYSDYLHPDGRPDMIKYPSFYKDFKPKKHTMREDSLDRWKAGMDIHMVINNRTKNRFQFAPVVKCVSVQEIEIKDVTHLTINGPFTKINKTVTRGEWTENFTQVFCVKVDGVQLSQKMVRRLAINDGFDSVEDFFAYFSSSCTRKLIHWTDLKY